MREFSIKKRIYYHDTDCGEVVYYANYLKYFEEVRTEYFRWRGLELVQLAKQGIFFVVTGVQIRYRGRATYADELIISAQIKEIRTASLVFEHTVKKDSVVLVTASSRLACVDNNFQPQPLPKNIVRALCL